MNVVDLFSGTGGWSQAFLDRGHRVIRVDNDPKFKDVPHTFIGDLTQGTLASSGVDVILASPPCQKFSVARIGHNWHGDKSTPLTPKTKGATEAMFLVKRTLEIVGSTNPKYWWMENPTGAMRRLEMLEPYNRTQVTFCQYGKHYRKPTDLWGEWPDTWFPKPPCDGHPRNGMEEVEVQEYPGGPIRASWFVLDGDGKPCHESVSRGSKTGVKGLKDATARGVIPYELSLEVCLACEAAGL